MPVPEEIIRETVSALLVYDYGGYYKKETGRQTIYLSQLNASTLLKRSESARLSL